MSPCGVARGQDGLEPHGKVRLISLLGVLWYLMSTLPKATGTSVAEEEDGLEAFGGGGGGGD